MTSFRHRYGPWALVVGGSDGLGAAFADELAARGLDLVLVARRRAVLDDAADRIRRTHGVAVRAMATDAAAADAAVAIARSTADLDVGLVVCNAANAPAGAFVDLTPAELDGMLDLNCRLVAHLAHTFGRRLAERGRTKAYLRVLAEGLWTELAPLGVDVVACCPGRVRTPTYERRAHPAGSLHRSWRHNRSSARPSLGWAAGRSSSRAC